MWWGGFWWKSCGCPSPNRHRFLVKLVRGAVSGGGAALVLMPLSWLGLHPPLVEASPAPPPLHQRRTQCFAQLQQATASYILQFKRSAEVQLVQQTSAVFPPGLASVPSWAVCKCSLLDSVQVLQVLQAFPPGEASHSIFCLTFLHCNAMQCRYSKCHTAVTSCNSAALCFAAKVHCAVYCYTVL